MSWGKSATFKESMLIDASSGELDGLCVDEESDSFIFA